MDNPLQADWLQEYDSWWHEVAVPEMLEHDVKPSAWTAIIKLLHGAMMHLFCGAGAPDRMAKSSWRTTLGSCLQTPTLVPCSASWKSASPSANDRNTLSMLRSQPSSVKPGWQVENAPQVASIVACHIFLHAGVSRSSHRSRFPPDPTQYHDSSHKCLELQVSKLSHDVLWRLSLDSKASGLRRCPKGIGAGVLGLAGPGRTRCQGWVAKLISP